jgi:hypothetical protein
LEGEAVCFGGIQKNESSTYFVDEGEEAVAADE